MDLRIRFFDLQRALITLCVAAIAIGCIAKVVRSHWGCLWPWICKHEPLAAGILASTFVIMGWIWTAGVLQTMRHSQESEMLTKFSDYWDRGLAPEAWNLIKQIEHKKGSFVKTLEYYREYCSLEYHKMLSIPNFFEDMGWLARNRYIGLGKVMALYRMPILSSYGYYRDWIDHLRAEEKAREQKPQAYDNFLWLAEKATGNKGTTKKAKAYHT